MHPGILVCPIAHHGDFGGALVDKRVSGGAVDTEHSADVPREHLVTLYHVLRVHAHQPRNLHFLPCIKHHVVDLQNVTFLPPWGAPYS